MCFFQANQNYSFECSVTSNPLPEKIRWTICDLQANDCHVKTFWWTDKLQSVSIFNFNDH